MVDAVDLNQTGQSSKHQTREDRIQFFDELNQEFAEDELQQALEATNMLVIHVKKIVDAHMKANAAQRMREGIQME